MSEYTREQMAQACEDRSTLPVCRICGAEEGDESHNDQPHCFENDTDETMIAAAAELRRTCATCQHFTSWDDGIHCRHKSGPLSVPQDGSGHCHLHEPKP